MVVSEDVSVETGEALLILQSSIQYHQLHISTHRKENSESSFYFEMKTTLDAIWVTRRQSFAIWRINLWSNELTFWLSLEQVKYLLKCQQIKTEIKVKFIKLNHLSEIYSFNLIEFLLVSDL